VDDDDDDDDDETQLPSNQPQLLSQDADEEDDTHLSITEVVAGTRNEEDDQIGELAEESVDDEVTDPTWEGGKPSDESSPEG